MDSATIAAKALIGPVTLVLSLTQLWVLTKQRSKLTRKSVDRLGDFGCLYHVIYSYPQRAYMVATLLLALYSCGVTAVGMAESIQRPRPSWTALLTHGLIGAPPPRPFQDALLASYPWVISIYTILFLVIQTNGLSKFLLWITGRGHTYRLDPGWINAKWHLDLEGDAVPVNIDPVRVRIVADRILELMPQARVDLAIDSAGETPTGIGAAEKANALLIATTIENGLHEYGFGKNIQFENLYSLFFGEAGHPATLLAPERLAQKTDTCLYDHLLELYPDAQILRFAPRLIRTDLQRVVNHLVKRHGADASRLATGRFGGKPSLRRADRRLARFPKSETGDELVLRSLFLKLAFEAGVWPGTRPMLFGSGFSGDIARLLLETGCLVTWPKDDTIVIDQPFRNLVRGAVLRIAFQYDALQRDADGRRQRHPNEFGRNLEDWKIAREVDYFLWRQSRRDNDGELASHRIATWTLGDRILARSSP